jgi:large subunit ribosomal protein L1
VTEDIATAVEEFKAGKLEFRNDDGGNLHMPVGKVSFSDEELVENIEAALDYIGGLRPMGAKGRFFEKITLSSTMSPGVKVQV